jgi:hypothetical protein
MNYISLVVFFMKTKEENHHLNLFSVIFKTRKKRNYNYNSGTCTIYTIPVQPQKPVVRSGIYTHSAIQDLSLCSRPDYCVQTIDYIATIREQYVHSA